MRRAFILVLVLAMAAGGAPQIARAQSCSARVTDIDFGAPNLLSADWSDAVGTATFTCTRIPLLTVVKICPSLGGGSAGSNGGMRLLRASTGNTIAYQLYQDPSRTQGWGALNEPELGSVPAILLSGGLFGGTATTSVPLYARLFGGQSTARPGAYLSTFAGGDVTFSYTPSLLGASADCTGFVGHRGMRPEFHVAAQTQPYCQITTQDLDFGSAGVLSSALLAQAPLRVACTLSTPYTVALDGGQTNAAAASRRMTGPSGDTVTYGLYRDAVHSQPWGGAASNRVAGTGTGAQHTHLVYGRVPPQATPRPGVYSDRVRVTVSY